MGPNFDSKYFHNYKELENDIPTDRKPMGSTFRIYGAHPSMCTHKHRIGDFWNLAKFRVWDPSEVKVLCLLDEHTGVRTMGDL